MTPEAHSLQLLPLFLSVSLSFFSLTFISSAGLWIQHVYTARKINRFVLHSNIVCKTEQYKMCRRGAAELSACCDLTDLNFE